MSKISTQNKTGINVRYIYSACVVTRTPDISVLHDPWFTEGIYDGSWYHFPVVADPLESIGNVDYIYVSHIHPDHYDGDFLKKYFQRYGVKPILISNHTPNHLAGKMKGDGITPTIVDDKLVVGDTTLEIIPHKTGSASDIDSAIIIRYKSGNSREHCVVNANDIIFDATMRNRLKEVAGEVDILLCGYTGAGPYPQTYYDPNDPDIVIEASNKKSSFFSRYNLLVDTIDAKVNIPFAGKYLLGGKLSNLNEYRGVADPVEILGIDQKAVVLSDNGGEINTNDLVVNGCRLSKYNDNDIQTRLLEIKNHKMDYERLMDERETHQLPLKRLLVSATRNATARSECDSDYFFCINLPNDDCAIINVKNGVDSAITFLKKGVELPSPRSEIFIDPRYLFGLLTHIYHWNNAEVGSQYVTHRVPNIFNRKAQGFLNYLTI